MDNKFILIGSGVFILLIVIFKYFLQIQYRNREVGTDKNGYKRGSTGLEEFSNLNPAKLNYKMGKHSNIKLTNCPGSYWRHPPANEKLITSRVYTPQGTPLPILPSSSGPITVGPTVDGTKNTPKDMFMFAYNQCKPECCPSTHSCSGGCICTTPSQRKFLAGRGNNKTRPDDDEF